VIVAKSEREMKEMMKSLEKYVKKKDWQNNNMHVKMATQPFMIHRYLFHIKFLFYPRCK
jgi:hypothetical protein